MKELHQALWGYEEWLYREHGLLVKRICARDRLSVQVHPNEETSRTVGGKPKTEMWCVLEPGPIFAGFRPGVTAADVERAVADGSFERLMKRFDAKPGECYFIPGGLVHAIGEGTSVYEVQQDSTTTFRLYDWGRVGADGKPRPLHVKEALAAMNLALPPPVPGSSVHCRYFDFEVAGPGELAAMSRRRLLFDPQQKVFSILEAGVAARLRSKTLVTAEP